MRRLLHRHATLAGWLLFWAVAFVTFAAERCWL